MSFPNFYFHPRMLDYDFGPSHPLKAERLRRTVELLRHYGFSPIDPGKGDQSDLYRVHKPDYIEAVQVLSQGSFAASESASYGLGPGDTPAFKGMYEASLAYVAGTVAASHDVVMGAGVSISLSGGLHHALADRASGFCVFNDAAIACHILLERFERVAYVDIDVHHGDGVQWIFYEDPRVLTCSIHESGATLWPGTGLPEETGADFTSVNVPIDAWSTGDTWLWAFRRYIITAIELFGPQAIVLQMGTDSHYLDPLAHLRNTEQEWLEAVRFVKGIGVPIVALGGGGYEITCVPRMWAAASLTLGGIEFDDSLPPMCQEWGMRQFADPQFPQPRCSGMDAAVALGPKFRELGCPWGT